MSDLRKLLGKLLEEQDIEREKSLNGLIFLLDPRSQAIRRQIQFQLQSNLY